MNRRRFFAAAGLAAIAASLPDGPARAALPAPGRPPRIVRLGRHFLVNGWVLTAGDLEALNLHDR